MPAHPARGFRIKEVLGFEVDYGAVIGQGERRLREFDVEGSEASLLRENLSGGFLCKCQREAHSVYRKCKFLFEDMAIYSLKKWRETPEGIASYLGFGNESLDRHRVRIERFAERQDLEYFMGLKRYPFLCNKFYLIDVQSRDETIGHGVFRLSEIDSNGVGYGELRFVTAYALSSDLRRVQLKRYAMPVGEVAFCKSEHDPL